MKPAILAILVLLATACGSTDTSQPTGSNTVNLEAANTACSSSDQCTAPSRCTDFTGVDKTKGAVCVTGDGCAMVTCAAGAICNVEDIGGPPEVTCTKPAQ